ncbi:MAG: MBL fold metallo-hydrolase, partial [Endomicrobiia bacterium]
MVNNNIFTFVVNFYGTNCYIYKDPNTNSAIIIDPGGEIDEIVETIKRYNLKIENIVVTHSHFDHIAS